ncbi:hypothetical protein ACIBG8_52360 [Nonomuraea sp. NPDC050556]|uniref:hypothetical protein n=1 Tax=Nonomuraea sp. NPDC050556 TaxID=3364369 RepID=UPI003795AA04
MQVLPLDPAMLPELYRIFVAAYAEIPGPPMTLKELEQVLLVPDPAELREAWVTDGGWYSLRCPTTDNTHLAILFPFCVLPEKRRQGVGSALFAHASARAKELGRTTINASAVAGSAGDAFLTSLGAEVGLQEARRLLDLSQVDWPAWERLRDETAAAARGYTLERLPSRIPDALMADMAVLMNGMNDAPLDGLDREDEVWTPERFAERQERELAMGWRFSNVLARHNATGTPAAFTAISVSPERQGGWAHQNDTVALREHRGHRLGLLVKLDNALQLRELEPDVKHVVTWNAESNAHMLAVNERMGFRLLDRWGARQLHL